MGHLEIYRDIFVVRMIRDSIDISEQEPGILEIL